MARRPTVHKPVRVIDTTAAANLTGFDETDAAPIPWDAAPIVIPALKSSFTFNLFNIFSPNDAPSIPVGDTINAAREGSAPINAAPANAKGVVIQRVTGANAASNGVSFSILDSTADENTPNIALKKVAPITFVMFLNKIFLYTYNCNPNETITGPKSDAIISPGPALPILLLLKYCDNKDK